MQECTVKLPHHRLRASSGQFKELGKVEDDGVGDDWNYEVSSGVFVPATHIYICICICMGACNSYQYDGLAIIERIMDCRLCNAEKR